MLFLLLLLVVGHVMHTMSRQVAHVNAHRFHTMKESPKQVIIKWIKEKFTDKVKRDWDVMLTLGGACAWRAEVKMAMVNNVCLLLLLSMETLQL